MKGKTTNVKGLGKKPSKTSKKTMKTYPAFMHMTTSNTQPGPSA